MSYVLQVDALGRQLARGAADGEEISSQREGLLSELAAAQQVSHDLHPVQGTVAYFLRKLNPIQRNFICLS